MIRNLSCEDFDEVAPTELWRVYSHREWQGKCIRHTNWFATEEAARAHAAWIDDGRGKVHSVTCYRRDDA